MSARAHLLRQEVVEMHLKTSQHNQEIRGKGKESIDNEESLANPLSVIFHIRSKAFARSQNKGDGMEHQQAMAILLLLGRAKPQGVYPSPP